MDILVANIDLAITTRDHISGLDASTVWGGLDNASRVWGGLGNASRVWGGLERGLIDIPPHVEELPEFSMNKKIILPITSQSRFWVDSRVWSGFARGRAERG